MTTNGPWINYGYQEPYLMGAVGSGTTSTTSTTVTLNMTVPGLQTWGSALLVGLSDQVPSAITDNYGLAYGIHAVGTSSTSGVWVAKPTIAQNYVSGNTVTITWAAASTQHTVMAFWVDGAQWTDVVSFGGSSGTSTAPSVTTTPQRGDELVFGVVGAKTGAGSTSVNWGAATQPFATRNGTNDMISLAYVPMTGSTASQTVSATLSASVTWYMSAFAVKLVRPNPVIPEMQAGTLVDAAMMNQLSYNAWFFNNPPAACGTFSVAAMAAQSTGAGGSVSPTPGAMTSVTFDNDGFGCNGLNGYARWIVPRSGYFMVNYCGATGTAGVGNIIVTQCVVVAGANNPGVPSGTVYTMGNVVQGASGVTNYSGVNINMLYLIPIKLYPGDAVTAEFWNPSTIASAGASPVTTMIQWVGTDNVG